MPASPNSRASFARQPGPPCDAPEDKALGQLAIVPCPGNSRAADSVPKRVALPVEMIAVARHAVLIVDATADREVRGHVTGTAHGLSRPPRA